MQNTEQSKYWLNIAIRRHQRHMDGLEPTSGKDGEISQMLMMEEMQYALDALVIGLAISTIWYDQNAANFPDKPASKM